MLGGDGACGLLTAGAGASDVGAACRIQALQSGNGIAAQTGIKANSRKGLVDAVVHFRKQVSAGDGSTDYALMFYTSDVKW